MTTKNRRLFELLVVGAGLWIAHGCGPVDPSSQPSGGVTSGSPSQRVTDGGGLGDGGDGNPTQGAGGGTGSGFW